jgi:signal transduction histidine kinase
MNVAIVGGGDRCHMLLEFIEKHSFREISVKVIAVAEEREDAPGLVWAREKGLFVTSDYNDFFGRDDIDLIVELTGNQETYFDILAKKDKTVRAIDQRTATLFWEFILSSRIESETKQELEEIATCYDLTLYIYDAIINELIHDDVMVISSNYSVIGLKREEAIGRLCYEITHKRSQPCSGEEHPCPLHEVLSTGKPFQASHVYLDKGHKKLLFSISCYPLIDNGEVIGMIEMARDITEDIFQKVLMQQDKMASIGRLAAGVAHEINNPLTTILTSAMLMQEDIDPDDPRYQELQTIGTEALRCRKIVSSLLDFARQTRPTMKLADFNEVIRGCVALTRKQAAFNDVTVEENLAEDLPAINMDKAQIEQALINLTLNAIETTGPGGKITINSRFASKTDMVEITVSDTGKGISDEDVDRIFEPFYTTSESGTGLGLAITHGIIEQHGGTIEVESKMGQGTSFTIRLPLDNGDNSDH